MMRNCSKPTDDRPRRVVIEAVTPEVDAGRFPIKRTIGERVTVEADVYADGHDRLAAVLRYRLADAPSPSPAVPADTRWHEVPMQPIGNDRWSAAFTVDTLGRWEYSVEGWIDRFLSWREELSKKFAAGQDVASELLEGAALIRQAAARAAGSTDPDPGPGAVSSNAGSAAASADAGSGEVSSDGGSGFGRIAHATAPAAAPPPPRRAPSVREWLLGRAVILEGPDDQELKVAVALADRLASTMAEHEDRGAATCYEHVLEAVVERPRARFGAWYELFPRSVTPDPSRSGTFDEAAARLPDIASMGFDVVYLPPVHPIGRSFRKGRNNALVAGPDDPGSPWAIGGPAGGHAAVDPGLGTIESFTRFVATARRFNLEVALDFALQASPDHPWVTEHPEWFHHRPDGTIKYAENPPKKYQDIYPLHLDAQTWRPLWQAVLETIRFWIARGVRIFRVDNPHTKPFRLWEWLIAEVRRTDPDIIFLAEAFTRPKPMHFLAKAGFSQSYTYFTWRNSRSEITDYFTELQQSGVREYFRPNLFANTPDILPEYLQRGGRPAFQIRLVLAATLGASYGIYSGFELCENQAVPGSEEYLDSEKYQFKPRDWDRPGNIKELIARVNQIRRENQALHCDDTLRFHDTDNAQLIFYSKVAAAGSNRILVAVNLDPFNTQQGWVRVPAGEMGVANLARYTVRDLLTGERFTWHQEWNFIRLDPGSRPAHILRIED